MGIEKLIDEKFRGCVSVCKDGVRIFERAYGYADLANEVSNDIDTIFATASAGKVFVAVGILMLIEKKILRFDTKISEILDFDLKQIDGNITVEELLTHTSGIPDYFDESVMDEYEELWKDFPNYRIRSNTDLLPLFIDKPMMYPHGSRFQYNNTGFVVLAMIIEKIAGKDFDIYLKESIFIPCKMHSTGYYELDRLPAKCASNYIYDEIRSEYRTNIYCVDAKGTGAGGAYTTVNDIKLFWDNLLNYRLLSLDMTENMLKNHSNEEECYGYGIWLQKIESKYIPYFQGSDPGVSFISSYNKDKKVLLTLISNYGDNVWQIHGDIVKDVLTSQEKI